MHDLRLALRQISRYPGFTAVSVITLALGIGANTAIFSVVEGVLLHPLSYEDPGRIVTLLHDGHNPVAPADFLDWQRQSKSFEQMAAAESWGGTLTGDGRPENVTGLRMGEGLLRILGIEPLLGRSFVPEDFSRGSQDVLILSYRLWQRRFGGDSRVVGRTVVLDNGVYSIIGIMPAGFQFPPFWATGAEMWTPLSLSERATDRAGSSLRVFARLKDGVTLRQAQTEMNAICSRLAVAFPETNTGRTVRVDPLREKVVGDVRPALLILLVAVVFVLLIACANVANLLLVRAAAREKEMAIRTALGAGRWRTLRQVLVESVLLAAMGGILGLLLGYLGVHCLKNLMQGQATGVTLQIPRVQEIGVDTQTIVFTLAVALFTAFVFGLAPALQTTKPRLQIALNESGRGTSASHGGRRLRAALVVLEIGLALMMLVGAGLLLRTFVNLMRTDPGFRTTNMLTMIVSLAGQDEVVGPAREAFYGDLFRKIGSTPGVVSASAVNHLPFAGDEWGLGLSIEGRPVSPPGEEIRAVYRVCFPRYFSTMGIALLRGRDFSNEDRLDAPRVVIINQTLARRQFANEDPIGKRLTLDDPRAKPAWWTIVGIIRDAKQGSLTTEVSPEIYLPWLQSEDYVRSTSRHFAYMTLVIHSKTDPRQLVGLVQRLVWGLDRDAPISSVATLEEVTSDSVRRQRTSLIVIGIFAGLALILAALGIYSVMSYVVSQRTREIGIRMALGARRLDLLSLVIREGMSLALAGTVLGLVASFPLAGLMRAILYGVEPTDTSTLVVTSAVLLLVAVFACWVPAQRAASVDPIRALRME